MVRGSLIALLAALVVAGSAGAGTIVVKLGLVPGKLTVAAAQSSSTKVSLTIADGRGNGSGWTLRASAPVEVAGIAARCAAHSTCTLPTTTASPTGRIVLSAAKGTGMGVVNLVVTLSAPASTVTFAVS